MKKYNRLLFSLYILVKATSMLAAQQTFYCVVGQADELFPDEYEFGFYDSSLSLEALKEYEDIIGKITKIAYFSNANPSKIATIDITSEEDGTELKTILQDKALPFTVKDLKCLNKLKRENIKDGIAFPNGRKIEKNELGNGITDYRFASDKNDNLDPWCVIKNKYDEPVKKKLTELEIFSSHNKKKNDNNEFDNNTNYIDYLTSPELGGFVLFILCIFYLLQKNAKKDKIRINSKKLHFRKKLFYQVKNRRA